jgi:DNA polymerase-3 subunit delta
MVALKAAEVERFLDRPDPDRPTVLLFGPDAGLVRERAEGLVAASVDDPRDPFALVRLEAEDLAGEPTRLIDEANTIPLFGGRRAVWVKAVGSRHNILPAVEALLAARPSECRVVIEAGDLRRNAPLRVACERARTAAAIACYPDDDRALARLVDEEMRQASLTIAADARAALLALIGGDRQGSRSEIRKLALFARGKSEVELDDVLAVVTDASALALDGLVDAVFAGRPAEVEAQFAKAIASGTSPGTILYAASRQAAQLHRARLVADASRDNISAALDAMLPPLNFRRRPVIEAALKAWSSERLARAIGQLGDAVLETRRKAALAEAITQRVLMTLATNARTRAG